MSQTPETSEVVYYNFAEAAELIPPSARWLKKYYREIGFFHDFSGPGTKNTSMIFFTDEDIAEIRKWAARRPEPKPTPKLQGTTRRRAS